MNETNNMLFEKIMPISDTNGHLVRNHFAERPKTCVKPSHREPFRVLSAPNPKSQLGDDILDIPKPRLNNLFSRPPAKNENQLVQEPSPNPSACEILAKNQYESYLSSKRANQMMMQKNLIQQFFENRMKYLHLRPSYKVKIDLDKIRPDKPADEIHVNSSDTYFYNTIPVKKASFTIDPSFSSEQIQAYKMKLRSQSCNVNHNRVRRNYAFVY